MPVKNWKDFKENDEIYYTTMKSGFNYEYLCKIVSKEEKHAIIKIIKSMIKHVTCFDDSEIRVSIKSLHQYDDNKNYIRFDALGRAESLHKENEDIKHPSFGMISINKFTGASQTFFGSSIEHNGGVSIEIHEASMKRELNKDYYHSGKTKIRVAMSYNQFAEAITTGISTSGIPCTIEYTENEGHIKGYIFESKRLQYNQEFEEKMKAQTKKLSALIEDAKTILSSGKAPSKSEKDLILNQLNNLEMQLGSNIPFIAEQFNETLDKTVIEAKSEIEGFYESKIRSLGIEKLTEIPKLIE